MDYEQIIAQKDAEIAQLRHELGELKRLLYGRKTERYVPDCGAVHQPGLFDEEYSGELQEDGPKEHITYQRNKRRHHGRNTLPAHLPVVEVVIEPEEDTTGLKKIGQQITETLEYTPASLVLRRTIRPKYADPKEESKGVLMASLPARPIDKCIAEPSLLSHILVSKFVDHLPYYRQIRMFKREFDWQVSASTINDWMAACCTLMEPLYEKLKEKVLASGYIQADESPIKVLDKEKRGSTHRGYQWVYHSPEQGLVLFHYHKGRGQQGPKEILQGYRGYVQCDGYKVYDKLGICEHITLVGCMAHARRKYYKAQGQDSGRADFALHLIGQIYRIEREMKQKGMPPDQRYAYRKKHTQPLMNQWIGWVREEQNKVLPKSLIGKAMSYTQTQWPKLTSILTDGRLQIDNNLIENSIRPLALGRKNYLFAGSHQGAQRIAMMYSFLGSCKKQDINPRIWLRDTLQKLPTHPINRIEELLPGYKKKEV